MFTPNMAWLQRYSIAKMDGCSSVSANGNEGPLNLVEIVSSSIPTTAWWLCYHCCFTTPSASLSLSLSRRSNQSTNNCHYFSLSFLYQGKRKAKTHETEREGVRFFFFPNRGQIYIFLLFLLLFIDFSFSFQSFRPLRKDIEQASGLNNFTIVTFFNKFLVSFIYLF